MFGRVLGYIWAGMVIVQSFTIISYAPWYGFAAMILAVLVIYALSATSGSTDRTASPVALRDGSPRTRRLKSAGGSAPTT